MFLKKMGNTVLKFSWIIVCMKKMKTNPTDTRINGNKTTKH